MASIEKQRALLDRTAPPAGISGALQAAPPGPASHRRMILILACCAPLFALTTVWCAWKLRTAGQSELDASPALYSLWSQLLPPDGATDIVVADSGLSLFQDLLDHQLTLPDYLKPDLWAEPGNPASNPDLQLFAQRAARRRFTSLGSATAAFRIAQLAGSDRTHVSIHSARDFTIRQLKTDNVILLGSSRANPWAELIQERVNFRFGFDQKTRYSYFENLHPRPGEQKLYPTDSSVSYCHIAFLPNLGRTGNILAIAGTEAAGTEGCGDFATSERSLEQVRNFTKMDSAGRLPYFEILLKSNPLDGALPGFHIVSYRPVLP